MLAKLWKNILLAICVIAILFNITSKLVRRYSLDKQLDSVAGGESLSEVLKEEEKEEKNQVEKKEIKKEKKQEKNVSKEENSTNIKDILEDKAKKNYKILIDEEEDEN